MEDAIEWLVVEVGCEVKHFRVGGQRDVVPIDPLHVRPPEPAMDAMGIALLIGMRMMLAVHRHPSDRIALKSERSENRQQVFERFEKAQAAMRQGAVEAQ